MTKQLILTLGVKVPPSDNFPSDVAFLSYDIEYTTNSSMEMLKEECKRIKSRLLHSLPQGCSVVDATMDFKDLCDEQENNNGND